MSHAYGNAPTGILQPVEVRLPSVDHFARRARRLQELAQRNEPLGEFLAFMSQLVSAQQAAFERGTPSWQPAARSEERRVGKRVESAGGAGQIRNKERKT